MQTVVTDGKHFKFIRMRNRFVQKGREVRPRQNATVLMKGRGGFFELPFEAVFGGAARNESAIIGSSAKVPSQSLCPKSSGFRIEQAAVTAAG